MIATTLEQSRKLIELGIDINTADMHYLKLYNTDEVEWILQIDAPPTLGATFVEYIPAWSLETLIKLLPSSVATKPWHDYYLYIHKKSIEYSTIDATNECDLLYETKKDTLVDACYEMIIWLKENNYLEE